MLNKLAGRRKLTSVTIMLFLLSMLLSGCGSSSNSSSSTDNAKEKTMSTDVVVVGSGATGMAAAIQAAQLGCKVIMLEKNSFLGGTTTMAEGIAGLNDDYAKSKGIPTYDLVEVLNKAEQYHHWVANPELLMRFYQNSADTISWLQNLGIEFNVVQGMGYKTHHTYEGMGKEFVKTLAANAEELDVQILTNTAGKELIMKDGKIAGIKAKAKDGNLTINAPVVILATGGYSTNPEMIKKYGKVDPDEIVYAGLPGSANGDGIKMALAVGASDKKLTGVIQYFGAFMDGDQYGTDLYKAMTQPMFRVNQDGKRFISETMNQQDPCMYGNAHRQQKAVYQIMTEADLERFTNQGAPCSLPYYQANTPLPDLLNQIDRLAKMKKGNVFVADTIDELADKIKVDKTTLKATIDRYNGYCSTGKDLDFAKDPQFLIPVGDGPYYAFKIKCGYFCTNDGLEITPQAQVLDKNGKVIPGLYAGGNDTGGWCGDTYDIALIPGTTQGWAVNSGRFAAQDAAKYLKK
jgi:fumarate reductase flavoprotein subunit